MIYLLMFCTVSVTGPAAIFAPANIDPETIAGPIAIFGVASSITSPISGVIAGTITAIFVNTGT